MKRKRIPSLFLGLLIALVIIVSPATLEVSAETQPEDIPIQIHGVIGRTEPTSPIDPPTTPDIDNGNKHIIAGSLTIRNGKELPKTGSIMNGTTPIILLLCCSLTFFLLLLLKRVEKEEERAD